MEEPGFEPGSQTPEMVLTTAHHYMHHKERSGPTHGPLVGQEALWINALASKCPDACFLPHQFSLLEIQASCCMFAKGAQHVCSATGIEYNRCWLG